MSELSVGETRPLTQAEQDALAAFRAGGLAEVDPEPEPVTLSPEEAKALEAFRAGRLQVVQSEQQPEEMTPERAQQVLYGTLQILVNNSAALSPEQRAEFARAIEAE